MRDYTSYLPRLTLLFHLCALVPVDSNIALNAPVIDYFSGAPNSLTASPSALPGWNTTSFTSTPDHSLFPEFVTLDLGPQCYSLSEVVLWRPLNASSPVAVGPSEDAACGFPSNLTLAVSDNQATAWRTGFVATLLPPPLPGGSVTLQLAPGTQGRYLRLSVTAVSPVCAASAGLWLQLARLQVLGSALPCPDPSDASWLPSPWPPRCSPSVASLAVEGQSIFSSSSSSSSSSASAAPAVVDTALPLFSFALHACERGQRATAFYLRVGTAPGGADLWDSGRVAFAPGVLTTSASYAGSPLPPSSLIFASLVLYDVNDLPTPSTPLQLFFLTAKLSSNYTSPGVWSGAWLGTGTSGSGAHRGVYMRSSFLLPPSQGSNGAVLCAVATFSLLGYGEFFLNGAKVGQALLAPGWTQYNKRTQYLTVDVTQTLRQAQEEAVQSEVALAVLLGDGWYSTSADCWVHHLEKAVYVSAPKALVDLTVTFSDGSRRVYGTTAGDVSPWVWRFGSITRTWIGAEDIDDNLALPSNWTQGNTPVAGTGGWQTAVAVLGPPQQFPGALLVSQVEASTRALEVLAWQSHSNSTSPATPYIGGGRFEMNSSHSNMIFWVPTQNNFNTTAGGGGMSAPLFKYQLDPGACRPCPSVDACGSVVEVPQKDLDALALAPTNFSCSMLPTRGSNATSHVFFFGREFQGWPRVTVNSSRVSSSGCSPLNLTILVCGSRDGDCNAASQADELGGPDASLYTLATGACSGVWEPRFMYSSVRTVVITVFGADGEDAAAASLDVTGVRVAMEAPPLSSFDSSEGRYNWMHNAVVRTQENYITAFPNDPTREKKGWTQDIMTMGPSALLLHGSASRMYSRWIDDITDNQAQSGQLPEVAPGPVLDDGYNGAWWGGMGVFGPWMLYSFSGNPTHLTRHYPAMRAYTLFLNASAKTDGSSDIPWGLGDWLSLLPSCAHDSAGINTPALAFYAHIMSQAAQLLGSGVTGNDATLFASLSMAVSQAYLARRLNATSGAVGSGQQCMQALALGLYGDFLPASQRPAVEAALLDRLASDGTALTTGFVTFTRMLQVLADLNPAAGLEVLLQRGALGTWSNTGGSSNDLCKEQWDGGDAQMPSLCGPLALWSFSALMGLRPPPFLAPTASSSPPLYPPASAPGLVTLAIKPGAVGALGLRWVNASLTLPAGVVTVAWFLDATVHHLKLLVVLPPDTSAVVHMPAALDSVVESGRPAAEAPGVQVLGQYGRFALLQVQSGAYAFEGKPNL